MFEQAPAFERGEGVSGVAMTITLHRITRKLAHAPSPPSVPALHQHSANSRATNATINAHIRAPFFLDSRLPPFFLYSLHPFSSCCTSSLKREEEFFRFFLGEIFYTAVYIFIITNFFNGCIESRNFWRLNYYMNLTIKLLVKMTGFVILLEIFLLLNSEK